MNPHEALVGLAHDSRRFDGLYRAFVQTREALAAEGVRYRVYTCVDPSIADQYVAEGTVLRGWRVPLGEYVERGVNRVLGVFARQLARAPVDLVHVGNVHLASVLRYRRDVVVTVPDIAKRNTRLYSRSSSIAHNLLLRYVPRARALLCETEWAREDLARTLRFDRARIFLFGHDDLPRPPGMRPRERPPPTPKDPWTLLYVAVDRPHKNLEFFLELVGRLGPAYRGLLLTWPTPATLRRAAPLLAERRLEIRSGVPDLGAVYDAADVLVFPSIYEGFGLPIVEAMARGLPIIASDRTCIPEVVGGAGPTLPVDSVGPWMEALGALAQGGSYRESSRRSLERAAFYTPERTRRGVLAAYESALA